MTSAGSVASVSKPMNKKPIKREQYNNTQVKGSDAKPKAKPGRNKHPFQGKLVGDSMTNEKNDKLKEGVLDATDEDGWMAKEQLYKISQYATKLHQMIGDTDNLEPWIQAKITKAADYMSSIKHYIEYEQINPHPTDEPAEDASMDAALELARSMESADPRVKKGMNRIFDSAQNDLANSLVK